MHVVLEMLPVYRKEISLPSRTAFSVRGAKLDSLRKQTGARVSFSLHFGESKHMRPLFRTPSFDSETTTEGVCFGCVRGPETAKLQVRFVCEDRGAEWASRRQLAQSAYTQFHFAPSTSLILARV